MTREEAVFYQVISFIGAVLILAAYMALQLNRLPAETITFQTLNLFGGIFLCITAVAMRQYGFILVEGLWAILSAVGLWRVVTRRW
jgi:hypothetical protein